MAIKKKQGEEMEAKVLGVILALAILIIAGFLIISNWKIARKRQELLLQIDALKKEIEVLEKQNQGLEAGISASEQEDYLEARIRGQGYQKPGETAVIIKKEQGTGQEKEAPKNIWEKFLQEIKGIF